MSVNRRKWCDPKTGKQKSFFEIYIDRRKLDGVEKPVRKKAKIQTRRSAEQEEREIREAIVCGNYDQKEEVQIPTFKEFAEEFIATYAQVNNKPSEVESKLGILRRYLYTNFGAIRLDQIRIRNIERFKANMLQKGLKPKTVNNALAVIGKILRYAHETEVVDNVPTIRLLRVQKPEFDFLSFDEADRLLAAAEIEPEWYAMIFVALRTGMRFGEICELRWFDVDRTLGKLRVRRSYWRGHVTTPKGGREREIPLSTETLEFLKHQRGFKQELVLCKDDGSRHPHRSSDDALKRVCRRAELRPIGWHVLRHTFASHLAMRGVPIKTIQELLGHTSVEMTMRYAHLTPEVKRDAVNLLDSATKRLAPLPNICRT